MGQQSTFSLTSKILLLLCVILVGILIGLVYKTLFMPMQSSKKMLTVKNGETYYGVIDKINKKQKFFVAPIAKIYLKLKNIDKPLHAGTYPIPANASFVQMLEVLQQGSQVAFVKVQLIEGKTLKDLYQYLNNLEHIKKDIMTLPVSKRAKALNLPLDEWQMPNGNLEGWFAPNTYYFHEGTSDKVILKKLFEYQQQFLNQYWQTRQKNLPYQSPYEALIMASIIEKETGLPDERAEVAGVFVNRLRQGMRLQTDPTVIYGMGERYQGNIRKTDLQEKTAYNTYQIDGLPPTPIAMPSEAAIKAALNPNQTESLYFVATGKGGHKFSKTLAEHNQAVQDYLKVLREQKNNAQK